MTVADIICSVDYKTFKGDMNAVVSEICLDSRKATKNSLFVAVKGELFDGNDYIADALSSGATGVISEQECPVDFEGFFWIVVENDRIALAQASVAFYKNPSAEICLTGITGTNGKTTSAHFLESIYRCGGYESGNFGTLSYSTGAKSLRAERTTPESPQINEMLRKMADKGLNFCVMEVSSHGAALHRIKGLVFKTAIFTNLTRDHLDFHKNMDDYFHAKSILFKQLASEATAVINCDDKWSSRFAKCTNAKVITYGTDSCADVRIVEPELSIDGSRFHLHSPWGEIKIKLAMIGYPNIYNATAAATAALSQGLKIDTVVAGLKLLKNVPGRFERIDNDRKIAIIVDFAHTDDALEELLKTVSLLTKGKVITVFGCGGNRDKGKRKLMGISAGKNSDVVVISSDNPRSENPEKIIDDIEVGIIESGLKNYFRITDREKAIRKALQIAEKGDSLVIAGKGHETYQLIENRKIPFDDREVVRNLLKEAC